VGDALDSRSTHFDMTLARKIWQNSRSYSGLMFCLRCVWPPTAKHDGAAEESPNDRSPLTSGQKRLSHRGESQRAITQKQPVTLCFSILSAQAVMPSPRVKDRGQCPLQSRDRCLHFTACMKCLIPGDEVLRNQFDDDVSFRQDPQTPGIPLKYLERSNRPEPSYCIDTTV
jgi:hypothetical protein